MSNVVPNTGTVDDPEIAPASVMGIFGKEGVVPQGHRDHQEPPDPRRLVRRLGAWLIKG
jgi:hypothetical protein